MKNVDRHSVIETTFVAAEKYVAKALELQKKLELAAERDDCSLLHTTLQQHIQETDQWQITLQNALANIIALESSELFSEHWWHKSSKYLYKVFQDDAHQGLRQWLQVYVEALIAWQLAICKKLAKERFPLPDDAFDVRNPYDNALQAIEDESFLPALDILTSLGLQAPAQSPLDDTSRATLLVFAGRIYLYDDKSPDTEKAKTLFKQARALAPDDGLPYAALGSYYHAEGHAEQAEALYRQANELSPARPDGYIGLGLLAEDQASWDEATDWYDEAIEAVHKEKNIEVALSKLRAPVSGRLYLQLARTFEGQNSERALRAVERAFALTIKCDGDYHEPLSYQLKGKLLVRLGKVTEAAEAYCDAGYSFYGRGEYEAAAKQFESATKLQPNCLRAYWYWADTLLMLSNITEAPFVDEDHIKGSLEKWNIAESIQQPDRTFAWVYLSRARICDQLTFLPDTTRWSLWWEAVTYVEWAILLKQSSDPSGLF